VLKTKNQHIAETVMITKVDHFSELSTLLSVKSSLQVNLMTLFSRFGLGRLLSKMSLEKKAGIPAVQLILSLCLFRITGETIYSIYKKHYYDLIETGKNCYYRMMLRQGMNWRKLQLGMAVRYQALLRKENTHVPNAPKCYILDDTTLEKSGVAMEHISRVFDHVQNTCVLGYKLLLCAFFDGKSTTPIDFSIHCEAGKTKTFGLTSKQLKRRFSKERDGKSPNAQRAQEALKSKLTVAVEMLRRAWGYTALRAQYVLCDSWFTCEELIQSVREIGNGTLHFVGLAKNGNTKYLVGNKLHNAKELITLKERQFSHDCRKYKCRYIALNGKLGEQAVRIFLIRYGRKSEWNVLLTSDLSMPFTKAFETYQIRWNIEVLFRENKQYLNLGGYHGRDFDGQIADCTLCFLTYMVIALEKRFADYETLGQLFEDMEEEVMCLTLWKRILACLQKLMNILCDRLGLSFTDFTESIISDKDASVEYWLMAQALEGQRAVC
jgi:hypothetical protein